MLSQREIGGGLWIDDGGRWGRGDSGEGYKEFENLWGLSCCLQTYLEDL